jgi:hypothetical protein
MSTIHISEVSMTTNGAGHEHIAFLYWTNDGGKGWTSRASMVAFVDNPDNTAYVSNGDHRVKVKSVHPSGRLPYVHTLRDGTPTDNLLYLPGGPYHNSK